MIAAAAPRAASELALPAAGVAGDRPVDLLVVMALLALAPVALVMLTSFLQNAANWAAAAPAESGQKVQPCRWDGRGYRHG